MPAVERTLRIKANPGAVFDVISRVEDYPRYSAAIRRISVIGPHAYRWVVGIAGIELRWEAEIAESRRPEHFSWRTLRGESATRPSLACGPRLGPIGVDNSGAFDLRPVDGGTEVRFVMEYRLPNPVLDRVAHALAAPLLDRIGTDLLEQVRRRIESAP